MTGGWLTPEDQAMWDAAAALTPPPHPHQQVLPNAPPVQVREKDPGPADAFGRAGVLPQAAPLPQVPQRLLTHPAYPNAPARAGGPAAAAPRQEPERAGPAGDRADSVADEQPAASAASIPAISGHQPDQAAVRAARLAREERGWRPCALPDVPPAEQQILRFLHDGIVTVGDVLASRDPAAHVSGVRLMLEAVRGIGPEVAPALMDQAGIGAGARAGDLAGLQRERLLAAVSAVAPGRPRGRQG
jgi:hypothetical protein